MDRTPELGGGGGVRSPVQWGEGGCGYPVCLAAMSWSAVPARYAAASPGPGQQLVILPVFLLPLTQAGRGGALLKRKIIKVSSRQ
jgi:hypothetical protein